MSDNQSVRVSALTTGFVRSEEWWAEMTVKVIVDERGDCVDTAIVENESYNPDVEDHEPTAALAENSAAGGFLVAWNRSSSDELPLLALARRQVDDSGHERDSQVRVARPTQTFGVGTSYLPDLLSEFHRFESVVETSHPDPGRGWVVEALGAGYDVKPSARSQRRVVKHRAQADRAAEVCRFPWSETWAERGAKFDRGRLWTTANFNVGGDEVSVVLARRRKPLAQEKEFDSRTGKLKGWKVTEWAERPTYVIFLRNFLGTSKQGTRTVWEYDYTHQSDDFDLVEDAWTCFHALEAAIRNEVQCEADQFRWSDGQRGGTVRAWAFTPGEAQPYAPDVLAAVADHQVAGEATAE